MHSQRSAEVQNVEVFRSFGLPDEVIATLNLMLQFNPIIEAYVDMAHLIFRSDNGISKRYWAISLEDYTWNPNLADQHERTAQGRLANRKHFANFVHDEAILDELVETARHFRIVATHVRGHELIFTQVLMGYTTFQVYNLKARAFNDAESIRRSIEYRLKKQPPMQVSGIQF